MFRSGQDTKRFERDLKSKLLNVFTTLSVFYVIRKEDNRIISAKVAKR